MADLNQAVEICKTIHTALGGAYFPALTGGTLYKEGTRKDIDIVIYRHRELDCVDMQYVAAQLIAVGFTDFTFYGWCTKCKYKGISIDLFNPEDTSCDEYPESPNIFSI